MTVRLVGCRRSERKIIGFRRRTMWWSILRGQEKDQEDDKLEGAGTRYGEVVWFKQLTSLHLVLTYALKDW